MLLSRKNRRKNNRKDVETLQLRLQAWKLYSGKIDGDYGPATEKAVYALQRGCGLFPDKVAGPITIAKANETPILKEHFKDIEFHCNCLGKYCTGYPASGMDPALMILLERVRSAIGGKTMRISSGYRCYKYNRSAAVGSSDGSQHPLGTAADIHIDGAMDLEAFYKICCEINTYGGVGKYTRTDPRKAFIHLDVRPPLWDKKLKQWRGARWVG